MKWDNARITFEALGREARRIRDCREECALSILEINAFSLALWEIKWAIASAQGYPTGHGRSLSIECIGAIHDAAKMAEKERRESGGFFTRLEPLSNEDGCGEVVPFQLRDGS